MAALAVFFHHVGFWSSATFDSSLGGYLARLDIGVPVFFMLSGFLMFRPVAASVIDGAPLRPALEHLWRRALRIYPAFWAALAAIVLLTSEAFGSLAGAVTTALLVHIHIPNHVIGPMPQAWSLATEIAFYASLPILARTARPLLAGRSRSGRTTGLAALVAGLYLISLFFRLFAYGLGSDWTPALVLWLPSMADYFAIGMALAVAHVGLAPGTAARDRLERWAGPAGWWWLAGAALFVLVSQGLGLARGVAHAHWPREMARQFLYGAIGFTLLFPLVFGGGTRSLLRRWVSGRAMSWLGAVSYSFYLWHMVFIVHHWRPMERVVEGIWDATVRTGWFEALFGWTGAVGFLNGRFGVLAVTAAVPALAVAAVSHYIVERPAMAMGRRLRRPVADPTPTESAVSRLAAAWLAASFRARLAVIAAGALAVRLAYVLIAKRNQTLDPGEVFPGDQFYYSLAAASNAGYKVYAADCTDPDAVASLSLERADVIVAAEVIQYVDRPGALLAALRCLCRADGYLIITTPNAHGLIFTISALLLGVELNDPNHLMMFTQRTLTELLRRNGWHAVKTFTYTMSPTGRGDRSRLEVTSLRAVLGIEKILGKLGRPFAADGLIVVAELA